MIISEEYELAFPENQEYVDWIMHIEYDSFVTELSVPTNQSKTPEKERSYYIGLDW